MPLGAASATSSMLLVLIVLRMKTVPAACAALAAANSPSGCAILCIKRCCSLPLYFLHSLSNRLIAKFLWQNTIDLHRRRRDPDRHRGSLSAAEDGRAEVSRGHVMEDLR